MLNTRGTIIAAALWILVPISGRAANAAPNTVVSSSIKPADGTSGQNLTAGSGVKTGHIQNGAVTPSKVAFYKNVVIVASAGGDFTSPVAALGAITTASATNPFLVKVMPGVYDLGTSSIQMKPYVDLEGSGESTTVLATATDSPTSGAIQGTANSEIRFLTVKNTGGASGVAICLYNSSGSPSLLNVTLLGSDVGASIGVRSVGGSVTLQRVRIRASERGVESSGSSSELSDVNITVSGPAPSGVAFGSGANSLSNVFIGVTSTAPGTGTGVGVYAFNGASVRLTSGSVTVTGGASGYGMFMDTSAKLTLENTSVLVAGVSANSAALLQDRASMAHIDHSILSAPTNSIWAQASTTYVGATRLEGPTAVLGGGTIRCSGIYDATYSPMTCP